MDSKFYPDLSQGNVLDWNELQEFVRDASPAEWLEYAEELRDSAELLWQNEAQSLRVELTLNADHEPVEEAERISGISRPYMLLAGFALENVLKGLLIAADPSHVNTGKLSPELKSHNLLKLIAKIPDLELSDGERQFCKNATDAIPYWGRYPIPLEKKQLTPEVAVTEAVRQSFLALCDRAAHRLYREVRDGWDSGVGPKTIKTRISKYEEIIDPDEPLF